MMIAFARTTKCDLKWIFSIYQRGACAMGNVKNVFEFSNQENSALIF